MDGTRFESFTRALTATLSRRAVTRALVSLTAGSVLAPLLRLTDADAKGNKGKRKRKKRKKNKPKTQRCGRNAAWCEAGTFSACCSTVIDPGEDDFTEICTHDCGCCDRGFSFCCAGRDEVLCCANSDRCAYGPDFQPFCCPPEYTKCGPVAPCCPPDSFCCTNNGACCPNGSECCPNGGCAVPPTLPCLT